MGFKFNPTTGQLDISGSSGSSTINQTQIKDTRVAGENISALKLVYNDFSSTEVFVASNNSTYDKARVLGIALQTVLSGANVEVLSFGYLMDISFSFIAGNELYLDSIGGLTETAPLTGFRLPVGYALSSNEVFIDIREIVIL